MDLLDNRPLKCSECASTNNHIVITNGANFDYSLAVCNDCDHASVIYVHKRQEAFSKKIKDKMYRLF